MPREPLWKKITEDIVATMSQGSLKKGDRFSSLREISDRYGVSDITSRRVLDELSRRSLITKVRGKGSFVRRTVVNHEIKFVLHRAFSEDPPAGPRIVWEILQGIISELEKMQCPLRFVSPSYLLKRKGGKKRQQHLVLAVYHDDPEEYDLFRSLRKAGHVCVCAHATKALDGIATVRTDYAKGMGLAVRHLVEKGHRRIAHVTGAIDSEWFSPRFDGYYGALKEAGLRLDMKLVRQVDGRDPRETERETGALLSITDPPTAIAAGNDARALFVLAYSKKRGIKVPRDLAVTGFDNRYESAESEPPLTTVDNPWRRQGREAVGLLLEMAEDGAAARDVILEPDLVVRGST